MRLLFNKLYFYFETMFNARNIFYCCPKVGRLFTKKNTLCFILIRKFKKQYYWKVFQPHRITILQNWQLWHLRNWTTIPLTKWLQQDDYDHRQQKTWVNELRSMHATNLFYSSRKLLLGASILLLIFVDIYYLLHTIIEVNKKSGHEPL